MAILWMGCQDEDFTYTGGYLYTTPNGSMDGDYSRTTLIIEGYATYGYGSGPSTNLAMGPFYEASSDFWFAGHFSSSHFDDTTTYYGVMPNPGRMWFGFTDSTMSTTSKIRFSVNVALDRTIYLVAYDDAGTGTTVASRLTTASPTMGAMSDGRRMDFQFKFHPSAGEIKIYIAGAEMFSFTGNTMGAGTWTSGTVDGLVLGSSGYYRCYYSSLFAVERDSRAMKLKSHGMTALDPANQWSGVVANINDLNITDLGTVMTSTTADEVLDATVADLNSTSLFPYGVKMTVVAARADDGPSKIQLGVKSGGADHFTSDITLNTGYERKSRFMDVNPTTGNNWTAAEINALHLLVKSRT